MSDLKETNSVGALEFLTFKLGAEEYGIDIQSVQELRGYAAVTQIANMPAHIKGVVNLRGVIIPIVDMRIKFGLGAPVYDAFTVVVILNVCAQMMGIVVDSVSDVIDLQGDQIKPAPHLGHAITTDYLTGVGTVDQRMLLLIDIEKLMAGPEMGLIKRLAA